MGKLPDEEVTEDVREILTEFWLATMRMQDVDMPDRMKASEMLAKYVLDLGRTKIKTGGTHRPSTAEVLKIAAQLEGKRG